MYKRQAQELTEEETLKVEEAKKFQENFDEAMDDDFNTADAIAAVFLSLIHILDLEVHI